MSVPPCVHLAQLDIFSISQDYALTHVRKDPILTLKYKDVKTAPTIASPVTAMDIALPVLFLTSGN